MIRWTRETAVGSDITGLPSVEVNSIGAGGGSIAWVDDGGLLHVGPESAGADPGPAAYAKGGASPTVTDACVVLGHIDPTNFLGGRMVLDAAAARHAIDVHVAQPLGLDVLDAALAIYELAIEHMTGAIEAITIKQGVDPSGVVMIGGGGGGGLYTMKIARRLGCRLALIPAMASTLSATGAVLSDLRADLASMGLTDTNNFDYELARSKIDELKRRSDEFRSSVGHDSVSTETLLSVEARYAHQVWEIEVPLRSELALEEDLRGFCESFHETHEELFAVRDSASSIEIVSWRASVRCKLREPNFSSFDHVSVQEGSNGSRPVYFGAGGWVDAAVVQFDNVPVDEPVRGPAIIESPTLSVVIYPEGQAVKLSSGSLALQP